MSARFVFIRPKSIHQWEALGVAYLAAYSYRWGGFKRSDYAFYDGVFDTEEEIVRGCASAEYIGFSLTSFSVDAALRLGHMIRKVNPSAKIVWGGYAVNGFSEELLLERWGSEVDYFLQGPGEESWLEVITGKAKARVIRKQIMAQLDQIPYPDRELIRIDRHFEKLKKMGEIRKTSMEMQRSVCPFDCVFCAGSSFARPNRRTRSAENIVGEMVELRDRWGMDRDSMVLMTDAEVFLTPDMYEMARLKIERQIEFKYGLNVVASMILSYSQRKTLGKMQESGLTEVWMGVESGPSLMAETGKPITPDKVREAFRITKEMGLIRKAYFILGFTPNETVETIKERIGFIEEIDPDEVGFSLYIPVPGSRGYDHKKHKEIDYAASDEYFNDFISTNTLSNADLHYWQDYLVKYFADKAGWRQNPKKNATLQDGRLPGRSGY